MQTSMPMRYDNFSDAQAFLKVTVAVSDFTANLHKHHGAVRDFMLELLSSVIPAAPGKYLAGIAIAHGSGRNAMQEGLSSAHPPAPGHTLANCALAKGKGRRAPSSAGSRTRGIERVRVSTSLTGLHVLSKGDL